MEIKELKMENLRSRKSGRLEATEVKVEKPMLDNRDMVMFLSIICSGLITYLFFDKNNVTTADVGGGLAFAFLHMVMMTLLTMLMFWITQKIVTHCYIRAKRKAVGRAGD